MPSLACTDECAVSQWLTAAATVAQALLALRNQPLLGRGPRYVQNPSPFGDQSNLYQVQDSNGNLGWQVRDANFVTGAPNNQVQGSAVASFNALWVPVLEASTGT